MFFIYLSACTNVRGEREVFLNKEKVADLAYKLKWMPTVDQIYFKKLLKNKNYIMAMRRFTLNFCNISFQI